MNSFARDFRQFVTGIDLKSRLRLAPTPSGYLHMGNAFNLILTWLAARGGGDGPTPALLFLRIDDLDAERKRPEYVQDIFDTLQWLGLDFDQPVVFQSAPERQPLYHDMLNRLRRNNLLFACRKSRRDLDPCQGAYPESFREQGLDLDEPDVSWRVKTPQGFPMPDFVVRRRDGIPAYQIASLADDLDLGITHLIRGADLEASTQAQLFLASCLGEERFKHIRFLHHPLLLDSSGGKLSKSAGSSSLKHLRENGQSSQQVFEELGLWLGITAFSAPELLSAIQKRFG
jgi:glutamyl/glutaminyl-tRNA synthetase